MNGLNFTSNSIFEKGYQSVRKYGAIGDGVTDDTEAIQSALDEEECLIFEPKTYKIKNLICNHNIKIDFNGASFLCDEGCMFTFNANEGDPVSVNNQPNYTRNSDYSISATGYTNYTGMVFLTGSNRIADDRPYYYSGFVNYAMNGRLAVKYPIDVEGTVIYFPKYINVELSNLGNITFTSDSTTNYAIQLCYGLNCKIHQFRTDILSAYSTISLQKCLNSTIENCTLFQKVVVTTGDLYPISVIDSSFTSITNCNIHNAWHCISTGTSSRLPGHGLSYGTFVSNSSLESENQFAYLDHSNGQYSVIENCNLDGACIGGLSIIRDCNFTEGGYDNGNSTKIGIQTQLHKHLGNYLVENCRIHTKTGSSEAIQLRWFGTYGTDYERDYTSTRYLNQLVMKNVEIVPKDGVTNSHAAIMQSVPKILFYDSEKDMYYTVSSTGVGKQYYKDYMCYYGNITIEDCNFYVTAPNYLAGEDGKGLPWMSHIDVTRTVVTINNLKPVNYINPSYPEGIYWPTVGSNFYTLVANTLRINSDVYIFTPYKCKNIVGDRVSIHYTSTTSVSVEIENLKVGYIESVPQFKTAILSIPHIEVGVMVHKTISGLNETIVETWYNVHSTTAGTIYYQKYENGQIVNKVYTG